MTNLENELAGRDFKGRLDIMLSNGTSSTVDVAKRFPIQMIESGPAAGVEAAIAISERLGIKSALSFDMGGTTAKLCVIQDGLAGRARKFEAARVHRFVAGSGFPVSVPVYDLVEIGAGGGSIAGIDQIGLIAVGPESAGASPGPACYSRGGELPTVTDANLVLGYLDKDSFLGGDMTLDKDRAETAIEGAVGNHLGLDKVSAANGIIEVVNETMAAAARIHVAEKGCDPSRLSMIAFGGAGPLHAIELARKIGCPEVVLPPHAGVMSSLGLLAAVPSFERVTSVNRLVAKLDEAGLRDTLETLREDAASFVSNGKGLSFNFVAEMRFNGQDHTIDVEVDEGQIGSSLTQSLTTAFRNRYAELYGGVTDSIEIEITKFRCVAVDKRSYEHRSTLEGVRAEPDPASKRTAYDPIRKELRSYSVIARADLDVASVVEGPVIIQERETCVVLHEGDSLQVHESGAIIINIGRSMK